MCIDTAPGVTRFSSLVSSLRLTAYKSLSAFVSLSMALATTSFAGCLTRRGVLDCVCFLAQTIFWFLITFSQQIFLPI